ncbi:hypothetical protein ACQ4PT_012023 [Festuca glaucescens]
MPPRKKHKSAPQVSVPDRIGDLPDCILQHVLSFLPAQAAVRTCVLARRWRDLWRSTRALRIVNLHDEIQYIRKFVDHLLILRERTDLDTVEIKLSCEYWEEDVAYVNLWIRFAVMYNVRVLTLHVSHRYLHLHDLPLASRHLTTLDLYGLDLEKNVLDFASCPALENLKMTRCEIYAAMLYIFRRDVKHCPIFSKLKTLVLNEYWCEAPDFSPLACILKKSPVLEKLTLQLFSKGPNHKVEIKGCYSSTEKSSAISEHLNIVEIKCNVVDEKILKVMKFLKAFNILGREGEEKSERRSGLDLSFIDVRTEFIDGSSEGAAAQPVRGGAMPPGRRPEGAPPPVYGSGTRYFTLEINHGGYFLGEGCNRSYVNGHVIWYDEVDSLTWSPVMLENIVEEIGYEMSGRIKAHYCIPFLTVMRNGLREIRDEYDTDQMVTFVGCGYQFISVYLDHDESLRTRDWDDVVQFPVAPLPAVISPIKPIQVVNAGDDPVAEEANEHAIHPVGGTVRQRKRARKEEAYVHEVDESDEEDEADSVDEDSDYDPGDILDSEYDINEGDDDLYEDNVDGEDEDVTVEKRSFDKEKGGSSTEKGKEKICKEEDSEGEDLWAPDSDEETRPARLNTFREQDLKNPQFHVGQLFDSVEMLRRAVQAYSCINMQDIKMPVNDRTRLRAKCEGHCSWYLWASYDNRHKCFMVKKYIKKHSCSKTFKVHAFSSRFLANKYLETFRADQDMSTKNFSRIVQKDWNMTPSRPKLQRARRLAMKMIYGDEEGQYKLLWDYANEIRRSNPGSTFYLSLDQNARFRRAYMCLEASKRGFLTGCRPIIFVDGCHIKTRYRGQLLTAVGMDPNDCIFPIAIAAVEVEDTENWVWFLETLKHDLGIVNTTPWTVMSDKHKGLISAVRIVFPDSEHRFCVRHMWQNFSQLFRGDVLKNQLWKIARSSTVTRFEANMAAMKVLHPGAWAWLDELDPKTWVRAFQSDLPKCDVLLNNNCVVFNKYILEARELPVMSMFDKIKCQIMTRHYNKQKEEDKWPGDICPKIKKRVEKNVDLAKNCFVDGAGDGMFQVSEVWSSTPIDYIVDLKSKTCTCNRWQKSGIPCPHVLSCMREERKDPLSLVDTCYSTEMHKRAYGTIVYPCKDKTEWEKVDGPPILPPLFTKHVGRPTKSRRKTPGEVDCRGGGKRMSRHGVIMHCSYCSRPDHNKKGCYWLKNGLPPPEASQMNAPLPMQPNAQVPPPSQSTAPQEQPPEARSDTRVPYQDSMVDTMAQQRPPVRNVEAMPTPESTFIAAAHTMATQGQTSSSTTLRQGELAQKLLAMQQQKNKAMEDRKLAILEAKYEAQVKKIEEAAKRRAEQEKRKAELAQARAAEVAAKREKKKQDAEINKLAKARTKEIIADVKRELAEKRKQEAAENKKQEVADKKKQAHLRRIPVIKMVLLPLSLQWLKKCACLMS